MAVVDEPGNIVTAGRPGGILHVLPSFAIGGVPIRLVDVINHIGAQFRHTIIALDNNFEAASRFDEGVDVSLLQAGRPGQGMLRAALTAALILRRLRPGLLLTSNWGAIEWAIANRLWPVTPHIHLEDGFGVEEADQQIRRRVLCRRWALTGCAQLIVPSRRLQETAVKEWRLPPHKVTYLPNGIDVTRFVTPSRDEIAGLVRQPDELIIGTVAPLRPEKNLGRLLRVFKRINVGKRVRLVIAGDGSQRKALARLADELGIADRVVFAGRVKPEAILDLFDVFTLSSDTEQMPIALLEAMAASRAVAAVDVGDVKWMVCEENRDLIVARDDPEAFAAAITHLLLDSQRRERLGRQNRDRVIATFPHKRMLAGYCEIFSNAVGSLRGDSS